MRAPLVVTWDKRFGCRMIGFQQHFFPQSFSMKIYTKTGDQGETSLFGGQRVRKDNARLAAYGTIDELNADLGVARAEINREQNLAQEWKADTDDLLNMIQNQLFDLGAELATPDPEEKGLAHISSAHVEQLEQAIDKQEEVLPDLKQFILPGGSAVAAQLHVARCVCRRAERLMVAVPDDKVPRDVTLEYVNRLSDLLFVLARGANLASGLGDIPWKKSS